MADVAQAQGGNRLEHFPVPFFAVVMGLSGLTLALHAAETGLDIHLGAATLAYWVTVAAALVIAALYGLKALRYPQAVAHEWHHPVRLAFFPAISISLLLLATATLARAPEAARVLWLLGMVLQGGLTIAVVSGWISARAFQTGHLTPAWFIPAVGNVIVPIVGVPLGYVEISWYFMAVGLIFWIVLLTLVMNRLIFHDPMPGKLQPTLVILIAPPAVGFLAWLNLVGEVDAFARLLLNMAYLFTLIVAVNLPKIFKLPFALSFWALSFPFAAITIASFRFAAETGSAVHKVFGLILLAVLIGVIVALILRTGRAIADKAICVPE
ncbi:SLAC1 anion channel family protein [Lutimaribacter sp. EGI FJ00015]|uniref:SLAC1 anion channel family protein n=1 Tax=Lutimaribacter degradans TaxID=2945989 RepID=A0ACC5ZYZ9_9RHOB|nr:SLAC1 anion channel family protein [Lutimaribacter sp. EGI FJ00013]MCM2563428.1 SLAC1 anion channel family protein [Lutimaribacter sp. EGI FJ00013]MCO0614608.1 SLAC1 anion channel family protein [Lutimaribacter sp. EGI FJ00015]MCO0637279.1 SLAC1 anion channel family protein [Lutimaribacter sp. EGI FJ00014]